MFCDEKSPLRAKMSNDESELNIKMGIGNNEQIKRKRKTMEKARRRGKEKKKNASRNYGFCQRKKRIQPLYICWSCACTRNRAQQKDP